MIRRGSDGILVVQDGRARVWMRERYFRHFRMLDTAEWLSRRHGVKAFVFLDGGRKVVRPEAYLDRRWSIADVLFQEGLAEYDIVQERPGLVLGVDRESFLKEAP